MTHYTSIYPPNTAPQQIWQVCPLCTGTGRVSDNIMSGSPYVADYVTSNTAGHQCPVCLGQRIIPTPPAPC